MSATPRILVVEDDARIAASVRRALVYEGYEVEIAGDGILALEMAVTAAPDAVILDLMLPGLDGVEVCRRLRTTNATPVLMLTARDGVADRVRGLDAGADDYLVKPFALEELLARIRALLRRHAGTDPAVRRFEDLTLSPVQHEVKRGGRRIELTAQEFQLLEFFLRNPRHVLSRSQLLEAVWGFETEATSNVVDVYVGYLRTKLEADGEPRLIQTIRGVGYVLREH